MSTNHASLNGIQMRYHSDGNGAPLVLLHGWTGSGGDWRHLFDLQALARDRHLIIPDLRGHGGTHNSAPALTHRQCALDLSALLDHLGVDRCAAIGLSMGGNVLQHLTISEPERVSSMVLVSSTTHFPEGARQIMRQSRVEGRSDEEWRDMRSRHQLGDDQIRALWRHTAALADSDDMRFTPDDLSRIRARTLIVHGDRDPLYPIDIALELYRGIPDSGLWIVPHAGHGPIFGPHRDGFARAALAFLDGKNA